MTPAPAVPRVGDCVEVRSLDGILATLDREGSREGLAFMPEMAGHCGRRHRVTAVMTKICGGGPGMRAVLGEPLLLLDGLRCDGTAHGRCSRACTLLWKPAWVVPSTGSAGEPSGEPSGAPADWPYRTEREGGGYVCQATSLPHATRWISSVQKVRRALDDVRAGEWSLGALAVVYAQTVFHRVFARLRRLWGALGGRRPTPVEVLDLRPGERVQVKSLGEILATLDRHGRNRGLEFSRYMIPFCGGTYRVSARMENFVDETTGSLRKLQNTVLLEGVACGGETTSGPCRRAEYLYWREIWLRRVDSPSAERDAKAETRAT